MRKPISCICENKGADQPLVGNPEDRFSHDAAQIATVVQ